MNNVLHLPRREAIAAVRPRCLIRHEEKTDVALPAHDGRRVVQIKKSFFDGQNKVEFALEKELEVGDDFDAVLADLELAVNRFFAS